MNTLGVKLRTLREAKGLSQEHLAAAVQVRQSMISEIERGNKTPSLKLAARISRYFNIQLDTLLAEPAHQDTAPCLN